MGQSVSTAYQCAQAFLGKRVEVRSKAWFVQQGWKPEDGCEPAAYHEPTDTVYMTQKLYDEMKEIIHEGSINTTV